MKLKSEKVERLSEWILKGRVKIIWDCYYILECSFFIYGLIVAKIAPYALRYELFFGGFVV